VLLAAIADSSFLGSEFRPCRPFSFTPSFNFVNVCTIVIVFCSRLNVFTRASLVPAVR